MFCSQYGDLALGWDGSRITINPPSCTKWISLVDLVVSVRLDAVDKRLLALLGIPRGYVTTYSLYGAHVGLSPRAAGRLLSRNPLPVLLPCHRVVRSDLSLGGYSLGVEIKERLLRLEGALCGAKPCRVVEPRRVDDPIGAVLKSLGIDKY